MLIKITLNRQHKKGSAQAALPLLRILTILHFLNIFPQCFHPKVLLPLSSDMDSIRFRDQQGFIYKFLSFIFTCNSRCLTDGAENLLSLTS